MLTTKLALPRRASGGAVEVGTSRQRSTLASLASPELDSHYGKRKIDANAEAELHHQCRDTRPDVEENDVLRRNKE